MQRVTITILVTLVILLLAACASLGVSGNAELLNLEISQGRLEPSFDPAISNYNVIVPNSTRTVTITVSLADKNASLLVNGIATVSGAASAPITLSSRGASISVMLSSQDRRISKSLSITVTPEDPPAIATWIRQFGTGSSDIARSLAIDSAGNVLVAGNTRGALAGVNAGSSDGFIKKYDSAGEVLWIQQFGSSSADVARAVAVDSSDAVLIAGNSFGDLAASSAGSSDAFVKKYDTNGVLLWAQQFGTAAADLAYALAVDDADNVIIAGSTRGGLEGRNAGQSDAFVRKYDANGILMWTRQFGSSENDRVSALAVDSSGNIVLAGWTEGALEATNAGEEDVFLRKYAGDGTLLWTRQFGTPRRDIARAIAVDAAEAIVIVGRTMGSLEGSKAGSNDAFVRKYSKDGRILWTRQFGSSASEIAHAVAVDHTGNILIAGQTSGILGDQNAGDTDVFVREYSAAGEQLWTSQLGSNERDIALALAADGSGGIFVAGRTNGVLEGSHAGDIDAFIIKLAK